MPLYDMYEDNTTDAEGGLAVNTKDDEYPVMATGLDHKVPTPEVDVNYLNFSFMFPIGKSYAVGKVIGRKIDVDGNDVERTKNNPIIDKREYCFEFDGGEVSELTANVISESMYTHLQSHHMSIHGL